MTADRTRRWGAALIGVALFAGGAAAVAGVTDEIKRGKQELTEIQRKLSEKRRKQLQAERREHSILAELEQSDHKLLNHKTTLAAVNAKIGRRDREIGEIDRRLVELKAEIRSRQNQVRERVRVLYQSRRAGDLPLVFASGGLAERIRHQYYLNWISQRDNQVLERYRKDVSELQSGEARMRVARTDLIQDKAELAERLRDLQTDRRVKDRLLGRVRGERTAYEAAVRELEESANRITRLLAELESRQKAEKSVVTGFGKARGRLNWPADGRVVTFFGRQKHPKFDTFVFKKGVEIESALGRPIRSVFDGRVAFADWFRGYGLLVIIDHGENFYSLYAHAAKLLVAVGDTVRTSQVIGEVGDTGLTRDSNLYFEIRHGGEAIDPLAWLKRR